MALAAGVEVRNAAVVEGEVVATAAAAQPAVRRIAAAEVDASVVMLEAQRD